METTHTMDTIVVGGGMAGLAAACYLARGGVSVTLFEKASRLGGRAATLPCAGYLFNRGIHALYSGGAVEKVLQELDILYTGQSPTGICVLKQGKLYRAPLTPQTLLTTPLFDLRDKWELLKFFSSISNIDSHVWRDVSLEEWLKLQLHRPRVRQFVEANARTAVYCAALDVVSAEVFIDKLQLGLKHPVIYIDGGWQNLIEGLRRAAEQTGVRIMNDTRVEGIEYEQGHIRGVRLRGGQRIHASVVIIATNPQAAVALIDGGQYDPIRKLVDALVPAQLACLDVALRYLPNPTAAIVQDLESPRFMSAQSQFSQVTPDGSALIYTFKQLDSRQRSDAREDERDLEALLDITQPGWRDLVIKQYFLPRIDAIGTLPSPSSNGFAGRPEPYVPGIRGLYLVGDWIGAEGFLADASMASARQVAQLVLKRVTRARGVNA